MKKILILLLLLLTSQARAQLTVAAGGTGRTYSIPYGIVIGGTITSDALQQVAPGDSLKVLQSLGAGHAPAWVTLSSSTPTNFTYTSIRGPATIALTAQLVAITIDSTYDVTLPLANSVAAGHGVWIMDNFALDGTQSGTRNIIPSGSDHLIIHQSIITSQPIAGNQFQSGLWISDGVSRWYCIAYTTSAL